MKKCCVKIKNPKHEEGLSSYSQLFLPIIIFLTTLFILLLINRPALYLNDEYITVNQLHQITIGHQTLINECKYGCYQNGTPTLYFELKNNILGYTLFLPIISVPAMLFFSYFGDTSRLPIIIGWSVIPLFVTFMITVAYPHYSKIYKIPVVYLGALFSIFLMMINLYYYHPFPFTVSDAPIESGAIILTNAFIGGLSSVLIYLISNLIWRDQKISLISAISIICCSSYLFWPGTAKDHILMTFVLMIVTYFFIRSIISRATIDRMVAFFFIGLLAWARPEMGVSIFCASLVFLVLEQFILKKSIRSISQSAIHAIGCVTATIIGSVPLLINNFISTKNPFIPAFYYYYNSHNQGNLSPDSAGITGQVTQEIMQTVIPNWEQFSLTDISSLVSSYFFSSPLSPTFSSIFSIFFYPESGNMSLAAVTPLFLVGLVLIIIYILWKHPFIDVQDTLILSLISIFILFVFIAYAPSLPGISKSNGIAPDMRYFLPIYFLGGLIGIYPLARWTPKILHQISHRWYLVFIAFLAVTTTFAMAIFIPNVMYEEYTTIYRILIYAVSFLFIVTFLAYMKGYCSSSWVGIIFIVMISLPLSWQFLMDFFYSVGKMHGYPFWMPYLEYLIEKYLHYNIIS